MKSKRDQLLGMSITAARNRLMRMILFELAKECGRSKCYRCNQEIEDIAEFSIEHKVSWMDSPYPRSAFFNLNNVSFSHFRCNSEESHQRAKKYPSERDQRNAANRRYYLKHRDRILKAKHWRR